MPKYDSGIRFRTKKEEDKEYCTLEEVAQLMEIKDIKKIYKLVHRKILIEERIGGFQKFERNHVNAIVELFNSDHVKRHIGALMRTYNNNSRKMNTESVEVEAILENGSRKIFKVSYRVRGAVTSACKMLVTNSTNMGRNIDEYLAFLEKRLNHDEYFFIQLMVNLAKSTYKNGMIFCRHCWKYKEKDGFSIKIVEKAMKEDWPNAQRCNECYSIVYNGEYFRDLHMKNSYGLSQEQINEMLDKQNHICAVCGKDRGYGNKRKDGRRSLQLDHNHKTGEIREFVCGKCNQAIGYLDDDPEIAMKMTEYLLKHLNKEKKYE